MPRTTRLASFSSVTVDTTADITPPSISEAMATSLNSVTVTFDEDVDADATNGSQLVAWRGRCKVTS